MFTGGLIGHDIRRWLVSGVRLDGLRVFLTGSDVDEWIPESRTRLTGTILSALGAEVRLRLYPGRPHTVSDEEIGEARALLEASYRGRMKRLYLAGIISIAAVMPLQRPMPRPTFPVCGSRRYHEDQPERIPGPELRRLRRAADQRERAAVRRQLGSVAHHAAGRAVPRARLAVHLSRADESAGLGGARSEDTRPDRTSSTTSAPTSRPARFTWTVARTRDRTPPIRGWDFRPATTRATCS